MRRGELAGMTWAMVDLKKRTLPLPETKIGEKQVVPLSTKAVRLLAGLSRRIDGEVWGMEPDSITQAFLRALSRARKSYEKECTEKQEKPDPACLVDLTFHDLRMPENLPIMVTSSFLRSPIPSVRTISRSPSPTPASG